MPNYNTDPIDIVVYRGDTFSERLIFTDEDGAAVSVAGWTIFFTIKKKRTDSDDNAVIKKTITDIPSPELGIVYVIVSASDLNALIGPYYYDFQMKMADGKIYTIKSGIITFIEDITRRITT